MHAVAVKNTGYFLLARAVAPAMTRAGKGKIVNVSVSETTLRRAGFAHTGRRVRRRSRFRT